MLYLLPAASSHGEVSIERIPVAELTAIGLERALLESYHDERRREVAKTLSRDPAIMRWATLAAERDLEQAVESGDEVVAWLAENLETQLARSLSTEPGAADTDVCVRLPRLVARFARYEARLTDFEARLEHEKLEAMKELAYGAGHEINNPLANIAARAQTLLQDEEVPERARKLSAIHRQAMRAHEMIADLMLFARPPKLNLQTCDVQHVVRQVIDGLNEVVRERDAQIACDFDERPVHVRADATQLAVAIHAVVINALEAIDDSGCVEIKFDETDYEGQRYAAIIVRDNGPGITEGVRRRMFDPFFSGREAGRGLGFGMSKCWRIVTDHGGRVFVHSAAHGGAEITLAIPASNGVVKAGHVEAVSD